MEKAAPQATGTQRGRPLAGSTSDILGNLDIVSNTLSQVGDIGGAMVHRYSLRRPKPRLLENQD